MKRVFIFVLIVVLLLAGCAGQNKETNNIKANKISIFYGVSSYAMFGADQKVIDNILNQFSSLTFKRTEDKLDFISTFHVNLSYNEKSIRSFSVDKNGIFWIDGTAQCYKVSSGSFDYKYLKKVYSDSQKKELG